MKLNIVDGTLLPTCKASFDTCDTMALLLLKTINYLPFPQSITLFL